MIKALWTVSDEKANGVFAVSDVREPTVFRWPILVTATAKAPAR